MSLFLVCVLILSYLYFINQALCFLFVLRQLFFVLPSKLYCDIIKATHSYLGTKKKGIDRHEALLALQAVNVRWEGVVSLGQ